MSTEITVVNDIVEINVTEDVIVIEAPSGAYPLPTGVYSVYGRTGNVVAQDGDYNLTQLGDVTITNPATGQVLRYNGTTWVNSTESYVGTVTSVGLSNSGNALAITNSPITTAGTINIGFAGTGAQYIKGDGTLATFPTTIQQAQRLITEVYNSTGATLSKGTIVYINGGQGNLPTVTKAIASGDATSAQTYGVVQSDITNNNNGYVVVIGSITDLDTQAYPVGTQLYLSGTTAGAWTSTKPYAPIHLVYVGIVVRSHPTQGVVEVRIQNGYELDELHDVSAQSPNNGDILQYVAATDLWTKTAGTTTNIAEGTNLYYTDARSRAAFSESVTGLDYNSTTGVLSTTTGYAIPTTASQATWNTAYNDSIVSAGVTGTTTKTLTLNQQDGGTITASWTDYDTAPVTSVFGRTGAVVATSGDYNTSQVTENTNLYFTNTRARAAISETVTGLDYDNTTGVLSTTAGYGIPTTASQTNWDTAYNNRITSASAPLSIASNAISISQANSTTNGFLSSTDWNTFNNKQAAGNYITALTGEATASGPGSASVTLTNSAVIGKVLTGLNVTGGSVSATDSILDAFGKVQNQINGLIGGSIYQGVWNASTNTPTLTSSIGTKGYYYIVNVAGTTNLNGITDWQVGDWAIYDGTAWQKVDNTDAVSSVNGFTGAVSLTTSNISEGTNLYFTNTRAQNAITLTTTGTSGAATYSGGTLNIPQYQAVLTNPVTGTGTTNTLPKFTGTSAIGNSNITDTGSLITLGSNTTISSGGLGIGATNLTAVNLFISKTMTGGIDSYHVNVNGIIQSDVTSSATYFRSSASTTAASFTLSNLYHYVANQGSLGAGSAITNQYGFFVNSNLTGATSNFGFYGNIPSGTNRWNLYMNGTAANYLAGVLNIGTTTLSGFSLDVNGTARISGQLTANSFVPTSSTIPTNGMYLSGTNTLGFATNGTLDMVINERGDVGVGATPSGWSAFRALQVGTASVSQIGNRAYLTANAFFNGTNWVYIANDFATQYFQQNGQHIWNTAPTGTASNTFTWTEAMHLNASGSLGIGTNSLTGYTLRVSKNITGANTSRGIASDGVVQSDVVTAYLFATNSQTAAATFSTDIVHYFGSHGGTGAGSTITSNTAFMTGNLTGTSVFGFRALSSLSGSSTTQGFRGDIAAAANNWNLYMNGTANNYMAGSLGIGSTSLTGYNLNITKQLTGAVNAYGIALSGNILSDVTTATYGVATGYGTSASAFTLGRLTHFYANQGTIGATSAITNQHGFYVEASLTGATNNYGFYGNIASGTNRWNLYMAGTAANYMAGNTFIGATTDDTISRLQVYGTNWAANFNVTASGGINLTRTNAVGNNSTHYSIVFKNADSAVAAFNTINRTGATASTGTGYELNISTAGTGYITQSTNGVERTRLKSTGQMRFVPLAADPTGAEAGDIYYNSTTNALKLYDGTQWRTITVV